MNPLPFFPPPARSFSQATNTSADPTRPRRKSGSSGLNLRHTLSLTGNRDRDNKDQRARNVSSGGSPLVSGQSSPSTHDTIHRVATISNAGASSGSPLIGSSSSSRTSPPSSTLRSSPPLQQGASPPMAGGSDAGASATGYSGSALAASASRTSPTASGSSTPTFKKPTRSSTLPVVGPTGRTGTNLPKGLTFDWVRAEEVTQCHALEKASYDPEDVASKDRMRYRQQHAPHLFLGAYVPSPSPKVAGPLSVGYNSTPRKVVGYINATASSSFSARAMTKHTLPDDEDGEESWLVCVHSVVVDEIHRHKGLGLKLLEEFMMRLRRAEDGRGEARKGDVEKPKGYECVAVLSHEDTLPFFLKAGFKICGPSHVRTGSGDWIELRRYIKHSLQQQADEKKKKQDMELELQKLQRRAASAASASAASTRSSSMASSSASASQPTSLSVVTEAQGEGPTGMGSDWAMTTSPRKTSTASAQAPPSTGGLGGFSQSDLLAALTASTPSYKPGTNPSQPFSSVLGQTLAGKTFVEDAFIALEARLVDKGKSLTRKSSGSGDESGPSEGTNLAEIWCPREECGCKIVGKGVAMWELAESGPLASAEAAAAHLPSNAASLPPTPQAPPAPASHIRALTERKDGVRSTLPGAPPSAECLTPIKPFWTVCSAMSFDNIGFSRDVEWYLPTSSTPSSSAPSTSPPPGSAPQQRSDEEQHHGSDRSASGSRPSTQRGSHGNGGGGGDVGGSSGSFKRKPVVRRGTFLSNFKKDGSGSASSSRPMSPAASGSTQPFFSSGGGGGGTYGASDEHLNASGAGGDLSSSVGSLSPLPTDDNATAAAMGASGSDSGGNDKKKGKPLTVKYLLCPNCDTGPLGYTIVPDRLAGGKMGLEVGEEVNKTAAAAPATDGDQKQDEPNAAPAAPTREIQVFLIAAERVRYRYVK